MRRIRNNRLKSIPARRTTGSVLVPNLRDDHRLDNGVGKHWRAVASAHTERSSTVFQNSRCESLCGFRFWIFLRYTVRLVHIFGFFSFYRAAFKLSVPFAFQIVRVSA